MMFCCEENGKGGFKGSIIEPCSFTPLKSPLAVDFMNYSIKQELCSLASPKNGKKMSQGRFFNKSLDCTFHFMLWIMWLRSVFLVHLY